MIIKLKDILGTIVDEAHVECVWVSDEMYSLIRYHHDWERFLDYQVTDITPSEWDDKLDIYVKKIS